MIIAALLFGALGIEGDSCQTKTDCESGLACVSGECLVAGGKAGAACKRSSDCTSPLRCRANLCVDLSAPPPARDESAPPPPPPASYNPHAVQPAYTAPQQPAYGYVRVNVMSPLAGIPTLFSLRRGGPVGEIVASCQPPCLLEVESGYYYGEITGEGIRKGGAALTIDRDMTIDTRPGFSSGLGWGVANTILGPIAIITGIVVLAVNDGSGGMIATGIGCLAAGILSTIVGPIMIAGSSSKVRPVGMGFGLAPLREGGGIGAVALTF